MGYQESYVTINGNVEELITLIQKLGKDHFEERFIEPVRIITLQHNITSKDEKYNVEYHFNKGSKFIYVVGERSGQRSINNMFGDRCAEDIEIYFTEYFPSERIFAEEGFALHEEFRWE
jgi:hypothetical protein